MVKEGKKDMKVEEDAAKAKYTFSKIYDYTVHKTYPSHADKLYKHGLTKRSKFFTEDGGCLYYIGGKGSEKPRLVVESAEERKKIIGSIHNQAHLGRDKTSEITARYYWPEMYNDVTSYVSLPKRIFTLAYNLLISSYMSFLIVYATQTLGVPKSLKDPHITKVLGTPGPQNFGDMGTLVIWAPPPPHITRDMRTGVPKWRVPISRRHL